MEYTVNCPNPEGPKKYPASPRQLAAIKRGAELGKSFVIIPCEHCGREIFYNPQHPEGLDDTPAEPLLRCPAATCHGYVTKDEDSSLWGCAECSNEWRNRKALNEAIAAAVAKHPYRAACYVKTRSGWKPAPPENEPENYEELVEAERE